MTTAYPHAHSVLVYSASFPNGSVLLAALVYLMLAALLARIQPSQGLKASILMVTLILTLLVGISRSYLGVHWPTDVLAGWIAGAAWALVVRGVACWLHQRGELE